MLGISPKWSTLLFRSKLLNQKSFVVLQIYKKTPAIDYTFLQSNLSYLPAVMHDEIQNIGLKSDTIKSIEVYLEQIEHKKLYLEFINSTDITPKMLQEEQIDQIKQKFIDMKECLSIEIDRCLFEKSVQSFEIVRLLGSFNILEHHLWSKAIIACGNEYKNYSLQQKLIFWMFLENYCSKFHFFPASNFRGDQLKFMFRSRNLQDLSDFQVFLNKILKVQKSKSNMSQIQIQILLNKISVIKTLKSSKAFFLSFESRKFFKQSFQQIMKIPSYKMDIMKKFQLYDVILKIPDYYQILEEKVYEEFYLKKQSLLTGSQNDEGWGFDQKQFTIKEAQMLLESWNFQRRINVKIMNDLILPIVTTQIQTFQKLIQLNSHIDPYHLRTLRNIGNILIFLPTDNTIISEKIFAILFKLNIEVQPKSMEHLILKKLIKMQKNLTSLTDKIFTPRENKKPKKDRVIRNKLSKQLFWERQILQLFPDECIKKNYSQLFNILYFISYKGYFFHISYLGKVKQFKILFPHQDQLLSQFLQSFGINLIQFDDSLEKIEAIYLMNDEREAKRQIIRMIEEKIRMNQKQKQENQNENEFQSEKQEMYDQHCIGRIQHNDKKSYIL